ncbi:MAG: ParB/RepB/Spo0J family partition protein [Bacteroidales bacterium]|nr:ParB/RepB/Spo0J family partition protein [Bacteroidales bacterium]
MAKNENRLGKGLGALIPENSYTPAKTIEEAIKTGNIAEISIEDVETNPFQPRSQFDEQALIELSESIKQLGIIQPITVRIIKKDKFQLISGERRLRASKMAGLDKIPAFIRDANDQEMLEFALVENIQRENLNPIEIAITYQRLMEECSLTQESLSERTGKGRSSIANFLRLLNLPPEIQAGLRANKISMGHAKILAGLTEDRHNQLKVFYKILSAGLSVKKTQEEVNSILNPKAKKEKSDTDELPQNIKEFKSNMANRFDTKVDIKIEKNGKGKLIIDFESEDILQKIIDSLN